MQRGGGHHQVRAQPTQFQPLSLPNKCLPSLAQPHFRALNASKIANKLKRVVKKDGTTNVTYKNISKKRRRYFSDLYTTLLDSSWSYCVILFAASFYGSWLLFGIIYYIISLLHGDLAGPEEAVVAGAAGDRAAARDAPCIREIDGFSSAFLFSLETQHTIGYGSRQTTTECITAIITVSLQALQAALQVTASLTSPSCRPSSAA